MTLYILGIILCIANFWAIPYVYKRGVKHGEKGKEDAFVTGYSRGRKDADAWWYGNDFEVEQIRQKIWREEAQL